MKNTWRQKLNKVERSPATITLAVIAHAALVLSVTSIMVSVANKTALANTEAASLMWTLAASLIVLNFSTSHMAMLHRKDSDEKK